MTMQDFVYEAHPARVVFGAGTVASLGTEAERLGLSRILVVSTPGRQANAAALARQLGARCAAVFAGAAMHTPVEVTDRAMAVVAAERIDGLVAFGGGSAIGLAKAIALRTDLPQIAIATTYAGSEMTPIVGETRDGRKVTQSSPRILPEVVIYDVDLTLDLSPAIAGTSGINAIAHAVEALYARDRNPVIDMLAAEGIRLLVGALPRIADDPHDRAARTAALHGAWLCGTCLGAVGMALHHKLCHTLGGTFGLPHAETHAAVLPHALAYNAPAVPDAVAVLARVLGTGDPAQALFDLAGRVGAPRALRDLGMAEADIDAATRIALLNPYWNPRPLVPDAIRATIARAWAGDAPA